MQAPHQHATRSRHRFLQINMRSGPVSGQHIDVVDNAPAQISMQVVAGADQAFVAGHLAGRRYPVTLGILHPFHKHRPVHGQVQPVYWTGIGETLQKLLFEKVVGFPLDGPARYCASEEAGHEGLIIKLAQECEIRIVEDLSTAQDFEVGSRASDAAVSAAFGLDASYCDSH